MSRPDKNIENKGEADEFPKAAFKYRAKCFANKLFRRREGGMMRRHRNLLKLQLVISLLNRDKVEVALRSEQDQANMLKLLQGNISEVRIEAMPKQSSARAIIF